MKKILLLSSVLFLFAIADAQVKRTKEIPQGNGDTAWHNLSGPKTRTNINNGDVKVHSEPGKYDLYISYKNKQATDYYAIDNKGTKIPASSVTKTVDYAAKIVKCFKCVGTIDDRGTKTTDCWDVPCPKATNATIKTAY
ncbi:MAG: hypothetical protein ACTHMV_07285 [Chitinophagaceae bacterium]